MAIFLDQDGVMADFSNHAFNMLGSHPTTVGDAKFWQIANSAPDFWITMPVMAGAREFFEIVRTLNPVILTGAPKSNFDHAAEAKREWWKEHFNYDRVEVVLSKNKHTYITDASDILVDDTFRIVKAWRKHGGTAIHFTSHDQALEELRNLGIIE